MDSLLYLSGCTMQAGNSPNAITNENFELSIMPHLERPAKNPALQKVSAYDRGSDASSISKHAFPT